MADVIVPANSNSGNNSMGFLAGVILLIVVLFLLFYYGLPALQQAGSGGGTQIEVPKQIDVNVNK